jgi:hypothetical protein
VGQDGKGGKGDGMTEPQNATQPALTPQPATETDGFALPDDARLRAEIGEDRLHERFLVRAALVATILVATVIATRVIWL